MCMWICHSDDRVGFFHLPMYVPDDFEATMVISGPASSLNPMALGGAFSVEGGRREGKREWRDTAGLFVSRVTCKQW